MHSRGADRRTAARSAADFVSPAQPGPAIERRKPDDRRRNGFISQLQLFSTIPYEAVETALADCITQEVPAGTVLLAPGQANNAMHLLVSGRLRIHLGRADSADYIPIEAGGCFGELSIIDGRPVSAYVVADRTSRVLVIHASVFWDRLIPHPGVARNLLKVLSERMRANGDVILARMKDKLALELLQKELSIAQNIQSSMLPAGSRLFPERTEVQAYAIMEPAKDVGGDFYDAFFAAPGRLFVAVGDVAGKGIPAALFMARTITQMRMEVVRRRSPSDVLEAVNRALCEGNDAGMFVTLFCGILETDTGRFDFANAGHNPPLLLESDGNHAFLELKKGLVAGIMENARYASDSLQFAPGQSVLLFTDGVTEAMNPKEEFYSEERLLARTRLRQWDHPRALVDTLRADIADFVQDAPQADDITMLALRYLGEGVRASPVPEPEHTK
jgi:sigma-B regulation protein RsbU (phosphoserine phosphatase)